VPVKKLGIKWAVFTDAGEFVEMFACRGKAEDRDISLKAAEKGRKAEGEAASGEGVGEDEKPQEEGVGGEEQEEKKEGMDEPPESYPCPYCDFASKSELGLASHIRAKHKEAKE